MESGNEGTGENTGDMNLYQIALIYYLVINIAAMLMYGADKYKAVRNLYRTPERRLLLMGALGGGIGSLIGMYGFHHKTQKLKFKILVPFWTVIHIAVVVFFILRL